MNMLNQNFYLFVEFVEIISFREPRDVDNYGVLRTKNICQWLPVTSKLQWCGVLCCRLHNVVQVGSHAN